MSAKTKIVVLHMKELIYTGIFALLGILFIILLVMMFLPGDKEESNAPSEEVNATVGSVYIPGIYTTELILGAQTIDVEVIVDKNTITSVRMVNLSEAVTTMYPLMQPVMDDLSAQIVQNQSTENLSYALETRYTSQSLIDAIDRALGKAKVRN